LWGETGSALLKTKADAERGQSITNAEALEMHSQALSHEQVIELRLVQPETNPSAVRSFNRMDNLCTENEEKVCG